MPPPGSNFPDRACVPCPGSPRTCDRADVELTLGMTEIPDSGKNDDTNPGTAPYRSTFSPGSARLDV